jgi:hypothetical protein
MQSVTVHTHVGKDGILKRETPIGIRNAEVEVILVISKTSGKQKSRSLKKAKGWPSGFFEATFGSIPDFPERAPQGEYETRETLE